MLIHREKKRSFKILACNKTKSREMEGSWSCFLVWSKIAFSGEVSSLRQSAEASPEYSTISRCVAYFCLAHIQPLFCFHFFKKNPLPSYHSIPFFSPFLEGSVSILSYKIPFTTAYLKRKKIINFFLCLIFLLLRCWNSVWFNSVCWTVRDFKI